MAFGPIMRMTVGELRVELAPLNREVMKEFVQPGMQQYSVLKYLSQSAKVEEDELEWFDLVRKDETSVTWGVWVVEGDTRTLIGTSALHNIKRGHMYRAGSGSMLFRTDYWGRGIASRIHMARTWYAFEQMGIDRIESEVVRGNVASRKALEKSGYELAYVERNTHFADGQMHHQDHLECLNPSTDAWTRWWHGERPPKRSAEARQRTIDALDWSRRNVDLP